MVRARSIGTRVVMGSLAVLLPATLLVEFGGWWLMRRSLTAAVDSHLTARVNGVRDYIEAMSHQPPPEGLEEELQEYVHLSAGDTLLEITDASGRILCGPLIAGADRGAIGAVALAASRAGAAVFSDTTFSARPFRLVVADVTAGGRAYHIVGALPLGPDREALTRFASVLLGVTPVVLVAAALGLRAVVSRALRPVDRITHDVRAITVRDLHRRLDVPPADDELRRLTTTFNDVLARLEVAVADITRFTADAAHELRTPVTLVRTTADVALAREERTAAEYRDALRDVLVHAEQMSALVGDLLVLARMDAGVEPRAPGPADLAALARDVARRFQAEMDARGLALVVEVPARAVPVRAAPDALARVLAILLDNAMKYTPAGGVTVRVDVDASTGVAVATVIDTGIGMAPEEQARVFDRFYRTAGARQRAADGAGLGLSIARVIVDRYGGAIEVHPRAGEAGSVARIELPLGADGG